MVTSIQDGIPVIAVDAYCDEETTEYVWEPMVWTDGFTTVTLTPEGAMRYYAEQMYGPDSVFMECPNGHGGKAIGVVYYGGTRLDPPDVEYDEDNMFCPACGEVVE